VELATKGYVPWVGGRLLINALAEIEAVGIDVQEVDETELWVPGWFAILSAAPRLGLTVLLAAAVRAKDDLEFRDALMTVIRLGGNAAEFILTECPGAIGGVRGYG
jgi:hypothetical protein